MLKNGSCSCVEYEMLIRLRNEQARFKTRLLLHNLRIPYSYCKLTAYLFSSSMRGYQTEV